jgi:hypothetical protein
MTGPDDDRVRIYAAERNGRPVAALVAREREAAGRLRTHMLLSPGQGVYAASYGPLLDAEYGAAGLRDIAAAVARASPAFDLLRLDAVDRTSPDFALLISAFRASGMLVQSFFNFDSRFEALIGTTFEQYLAQRPAPLRLEVERCLRQSAQDGGPGFELIAGGPGLASALVDYALTDLQSTTMPEMYPEATLELARVAAARGVLRLGLIYVDGEPAASQIWFVGAGKATLWRLRSAERFARHSVDVALMAEMLRHLIEADGVKEIEFAREFGDCREAWLADVRRRKGIVVFNPRSAKGLASGVWHIGGHAGKSAARRVRAAWRAARGR